MCFISLYFLFCCYHLCTILFLFQRFNYDHDQPIILVEKTRQKEIRKGNDWVHFKIYTAWGQFFLFVLRHTNNLWFQTNWLSLSTPLKCGVGDVPGILLILFPTRCQSSDVLWMSGESTREHGEGTGDDRVRHKYNFSQTEKSFRSKEIHSKWVGKKNTR